MNILLYMPPGSDPENRFIKLISESVLSNHIQIYNRIEDISKRLATPTKDIVLAVFLIRDAKEISQFVSMGPVLSELRIILVLPDRKKQTLDQAYKLFPRYVCTINDSFDELSLIVKKITKNISINLKEDI